MKVLNPVNHLGGCRQEMQAQLSAALPSLWLREGEFCRIYQDPVLKSSFQSYLRSMIVPKQICFDGGKAE